IGSTESMGICHSYAPDGRCISLLKILLTNFCIFDCRYCVNRNSSNVRRARFTVEEVVQLTLDFYKRNYIEGLFLSSGIIRSSDHTMEELVRVARILREEHAFQGYIHLKSIPDASPELLDEAGRYADRLSINVEMPTERGLETLAPEKGLPDIKRAMAGLRLKIDEAKAEKKVPRFSPGGQSTQMIVGADAADDRTILDSSSNLYASYRLRRVYYSAFSPIPDASRFLPLNPPPLVREHRLYQADWLMRFYRFGVEEIVPAPANDADAMLDLDIDPKLAWALRNRDWFPLDLNRASRSELLRVPGLGVRTVERILSARRHRTIRLDDLSSLRVSLRKIAPFVETVDHRPGRELESGNLRARFARPAEQLSLFDAAGPHV
ncbi:MAG: putative DNA modification/repair radical SAM protein, partial [Alphaproteobacteria bacterium]|nr:putative DNA modification/repair radical SAM protein [Alphaproteobacteria bacterium]